MPENCSLSGLHLCLGDSESTLLNLPTPFNVKGHQKGHNLAGELQFNLTENSSL